jgi:hypothetical protein
MIQVVALLQIDEEILKNANLGDEDIDLTLYGEMGKVALSGIFLTDYKIVSKSKDEFQDFKNNKALIISCENSEQIPKLNTIDQ